MDFFRRAAGCSRVAVVSAAVIAIAACPAALAQTITGTVRGTVTDPQGAVVPGAQVTATNESTRVSTSTVTTHDGTYSIQFLPIGSYLIVVNSSGFKRVTVGPFRLEIDQIAKIDARLEVGEAAATVNVSATASLLQTEDATLGTTISGNTMVNMPMNGLNYQFPTLFVPGAVLPSLAYMAGADGNERNADWYSSPSFNGARGQNNNYVMDGVEIDETLNNYSGYNPAPDSIQEMRVITGNANAEYGNVSGGEILVVTRGGTNHLHGSVYEYFQNNGMSANSWANNFSGIPLAPFTQNQFGASLGGPILKDRLFIFGDYEGFRYHTGGTGVATVATAKMRTGDFSELLTDQYGDVQLYNNQLGGGFSNATPYVKNQITIKNPVAKFLFAHPELYPLPNTTPIPGLGDLDNYQGYFKKQTVNNQGDVRVDYKLGANDSLMGRYSYGDAFDFTARPLVPVIFPVSNDYPFQSAVVNWVHQLSPSMVNEFRVGFSRTVYDQAIPSDPSGVFGASGNSVVGIPFANQAFPGFSEVSLPNSNESNLGTSALVNQFHENNFYYGDNFTWQHGKHNTKFGVQILRYQQNSFYPGNAGALGSFAYSGVYTENPALAVTEPGYGLADWVLDQSDGAKVGGVAGPNGQRQYRDAAYVQDDWKLRDNLTVNLGVRYGWDQPIYEVNDKQANVANSAIRNPSPLNGPSVIQYAGKNGASRALYDPYHWQFMPRIGFALQLSPRVVFRGAYGITDDLEGTGTNHRLTQNAPFLSQFGYSPTPPTNTTSGGAPIPVENGFQLSSGTVSYTNNNFNAFPANLRPALVQQFNLGGQMLVTRNTTAQLGYVGNIGRHLIVPVQENQWSSPATGALANSNCSSPNSAPFCGIVGNQGNFYVTESGALSNYNALQATLHHQNANGLEGTINYTWAKSLTNNAGFYGVEGVSEATSFYQNIYDPMGDYGPAGEDTRNSLNANAIYSLPFGKGRRFGSGWNMLTDEVLGGWQLSGDAILYSGFPLKISTPIRYDVYANTAHSIHFRPLRITHRTTQNWFGTDPSAVPCLTADKSGNTIDNGTCAYGTESYTGFGNTQNGSERAPGFRQIDLSAFKTFHITETHTLELRGDAFNAFNIASYGPPNASLTAYRPTTPGFGLIKTTLSSQRVMQVSMHYRF
ncbi:MAG TPA: TonB-dependent receptor [Acidobacteriaceae bacterium]